MFPSFRPLQLLLILVCGIFCTLFFILFDRSTLYLRSEVHVPNSVLSPHLITSSSSSSSLALLTQKFEQYSVGMSSYIPLSVFSGSFAKSSLSALDTSFVLKDQTNMLSQNSEDITAFRNLFLNKRNGVFMELGALDGTKFSNTFFFQKELDWYGILIEPNTHSFVQLLQSRCVNSRNLCLNTAVCSQARPVHFAHADAVGGIIEFMSPAFMQRFHPDLVADPSSANKLPVIPCVPVGTLFKLFGILHIDWLSLDVEGGELEVIKTIDFNSVNIQVLTIELDGTNPSKDKEVKDILLANGYRLLEAPAFQLTNSWFVHKSFVASS
jgi:FkbM family methyltransferase